MVPVAEAYFDGLSKKFSAVAQQVPSLTKLRRRLILSGEDGLRDVFACGMARHSGSPAEIRFKEDDAMSEFAMVEVKLEEALEVVRKAAPVNQDQETTSADAVVATDAPGSSAGASAECISDTQKQQSADAVVANDTTPKSSNRPRNRSQMGRVHRATPPTLSLLRQLTKRIGLKLGPAWTTCC